MEIFETFIRLIVGITLFVVLILNWALIPFFDPSVELNLTFVSAFYGNAEPSGWVRFLLLCSRFSFGAIFTLWALIPAFRYFVDFEPRPYIGTVLIVGSLSTVILFFASLVIQQTFHL